MKRIATLLLSLLLSLLLVLPAGAEATTAAQGAYKIAFKAGQAALNAKDAPKEIEAEATLGMLDGVPYLTLASPFNKPLTLCYTPIEGALLHDIEQDAWHRLTYQGTSFTPENHSAAFKEQTGYAPEDFMAALSTDAALLIEKLSAYAQALGETPAISLLLTKLRLLDTDSGSFSLSGSEIRAALMQIVSPIMPYLYQAQQPVFDGLALKDIYEQLYWTNRSQINRALRDIALGIQSFTAGDALDFSLQWNLPNFVRFYCPAFDIVLNIESDGMNGVIHAEGQQDILLDGTIDEYQMGDLSRSQIVLNARSAQFEATASLTACSNRVYIEYDNHAKNIGNETLNILMTGRTRGEDGAWGESFRWTADCVAQENELLLSFDLNASRATLVLNADDHKVSLAFDAGVENAPTASRAAFIRYGIPAKINAALEQFEDGGYLLTYDDEPMRTAPRYMCLCVAPVTPALTLPTGEIPSMEIEDAVAAFLISTAEPEPTP